MLKYLQQIADISLTLQPQSKRNSFFHCGVMKLLADMPSRLGGGDYSITKCRADRPMVKADQG